MNKPMVVAGIDGGATHTRAVLLDASGTLLGSGCAGSSSYDEVGYEAARQNIGLALQGAWQAAGTPVRLLDSIFLGMAGVVSPKDRLNIERMILGLGVAEKGHIFVDHDLRIALAAGLADAPGMVLIVGTGCSCYGRRADGAEWRAGGWGSLLDDRGSGYDLGLQAMVSTVRAADGRGEPTALHEPVLKFLGIRNVSEILHRLHVEGMGKAEIAQMARIVIESADAGDSVAQAILLRGAEELGLLVETVARRLNLLDDETLVTYAGGLIQSAATYRNFILSGIRRRLPQCRIMEPQLDPVLGAGLLALKAIGISPGQAIRDRLRARSGCVERTGE